MAPLEGEEEAAAQEEISDAQGREIEADLSILKGMSSPCSCPPIWRISVHLAIRENIDLGRDISNLIDPSVQDYIYRNSLYLREPQYKQIIRAGFLEFHRVKSPSPEIWEELRAAVRHEVEKLPKVSGSGRRRIRSTSPPGWTRP